MNEARKRRLGLKTRIETAKKKNQELEDREFELISTIPCRHGIALSRNCQACDEIISEVDREYMSSPEVMEARLRHEFGLDETRPAFIFLNQTWGYGPRIVSIELSIHNPTQIIMDMKKNGVWALDKGYPTWFAPEQILEVLFDDH